MAIFSQFMHAARRDGAAQVDDKSPSITDRSLATLEAWIDMRMRRERARLDALIVRAPQNVAPDKCARAEWWRSWRACTRRRGRMH